MVDKIDALLPPTVAPRFLALGMALQQGMLGLERRK
jgi:hypothetical protein